MEEEKVLFTVSSDIPERCFGDILELQKLFKEVCRTAEVMVIGDDFKNKVPKKITITVYK